MENITPKTTTMKNNTDVVVPKASVKEMIMRNLAKLFKLNPRLRYAVEDVSKDGDVSINEKLLINLNPTEEETGIISEIKNLNKAKNNKKT